MSALDALKRVRQRASSEVAPIANAQGDDTALQALRRVSQKQVQPQVQQEQLPTNPLNVGEAPLRKAPTRPIADSTAQPVDAQPNLAPRPQRQPITPPTQQSSPQDADLDVIGKLRDLKELINHVTEPSQEEAMRNFWEHEKAKEQSSGKQRSELDRVAGILEESGKYLGYTAPEETGQHKFNTYADFARVAIPAITGLVTANPAVAALAGGGTELLTRQLARNLGYAEGRTYREDIRSALQAGVGEGVGQGIGNLAAKTTQLFNPAYMGRMKVRSEIEAAARRPPLTAEEQFRATVAGKNERALPKEGEILGYKPGMSGDLSIAQDEVTRRQKIIQEGNYQPTLEMATGSEFAGSLEQKTSQNIATAARFKDIALHNAQQFAEQKNQALAHIGTQQDTLAMGQQVRTLYDETAKHTIEAHQAADELEAVATKVHAGKLSPEDAALQMNHQKDVYYEQKLEAMNKKAKINYGGIAYPTIGDFGFVSPNIVNKIREIIKTTPSMSFEESARVEEKLQKVLDRFEKKTKSRPTSSYSSGYKGRSSDSSGDEWLKTNRFMTAQEFNANMGEVGKEVAVPGKLLGKDVSPEREAQIADQLYTAIMEDFEHNIARGKSQNVDVATLEHARNEYRRDIEEIKAFKDYNRKVFFEAMAPETIVHNLSRTWGPTRIKEFTRIMGKAVPESTAAVRSAATRDVFRDVFDVSPETNEHVLNPKKFYETYANNKARIDAIVGPKAAAQLSQLSSKMLELSSKSIQNKAHAYMQHPVADIVKYIIGDANPDKVRYALRELNGKDPNLTASIQRQYLHDALVNKTSTELVDVPSSVKVNSALHSGREREMLKAVMLDDTEKLARVENLREHAAVLAKSERRRMGSQTNPLEETRKLMDVVRDMVAGDMGAIQGKVASFMFNRSVAKMISEPDGIKAILGVLPFPKVRASFVNATLNYLDQAGNLGVLHEKQQEQLQSRAQ